MNNTILIVIALLVILGGGYLLMERSSPSASDIQADVTAAPTGAPVAPTEAMPVPGESPAGGEMVVGNAVEFTMNSWMERTADGKMSAHFSLPEIKVKKGDKVKITVTNTNGTHDFVIDEYAVKVDTPLNEPTVVEFVADKAGSFEYYCSKYNHRQLGQKGTLIVGE